MKNRQHVPPVLVNVAQSVQLLLRVGEITNARLVIHILERIDSLSLAILAANKPARLLRRIGARTNNQLL